MDTPPIYALPQDTLQQIFSALPLRQIIVCRSVSKLFNQILTSPSFLHHISIQSLPLSLLALRPPHHHRHVSHSVLSALHVFDPNQNICLRFDLSFLPFRSLHPVASSQGLLYVWGHSPDLPESNKSLIACNPLTRQFKVLPQLGSAWSKHGSVMVDSRNQVMVLTELAALFYSNSVHYWLTFSSNLPSKPRSPVMMSDSVYALCDVGSPWRSQWKLFTCKLSTLANSQQFWYCLEKHEWGDVFDILKRPRLIRGIGNRVLMIGGLKSSYSINSSCSTIIILRLDLDLLEWEEAGRMPGAMYKYFQESNKFKVFGMGDRVCFSAKRVGKLALWECRKGGEGGGGDWRWIDGLAVSGDGPSRGFVLEASLNAVP